MLRAVHDNVNIVTNLVTGQVVLHADSAMLSESFSEKLSSLSSKPSGVSHPKDLLKTL